MLTLEHRAAAVSSETVQLVLTVFSLLSMLILITFCSRCRLLKNRFVVFFPANLFFIFMCIGEQIHVCSLTQSNQAFHLYTIGETVSYVSGKYQTRCSARTGERRDDFSHHHTYIESPQGAQRLPP